jgi:hypothetical protein
MTTSVLKNILKNILDHGRNFDLHLHLGLGYGLSIFFRVLSVGLPEANCQVFRDKMD